MPAWQCVAHNGGVAGQPGACHACARLRCLMRRSGRRGSGRRGSGRRGSGRRGSARRGTQCRPPPGTRNGGPFRPAYVDGPLVYRRRGARNCVVAHRAAVEQSDRNQRDQTARRSPPTGLACHPRIPSCVLRLKWRQCPGYGAARYGPARSSPLPSPIWTRRVNLGQVAVADSTAVGRLLPAR